MKIIIGNDHRGLKLKEQILKYLLSKNYDVENIGTDTDASVNYPEYALKLCEKVKQEDALGILICGTGIGMSIVANKVKGIRAALCSDCFSAQATKEHNNANVLCLGARVIGPELAFRIADTFLESKFSNAERHIKRISMLE